MQWGGVSPARHVLTCNSVLGGARHSHVTVLLGFAVCWSHGGWAYPLAMDGKMIEGEIGLCPELCRTLDALFNPTLYNMFGKNLSLTLVGGVGFRGTHGEDSPLLVGFRGTHGEDSPLLVGFRGTHGEDSPLLVGFRNCWWKWSGCGDTTGHIWEFFCQVILFQLRTKIT